MSMYPSSDVEKMRFQEQPQQGYEPPPPYGPETAPSAPVGQNPTTVTVIVDDGKFGPFPKAMKCYHCGQQIMTTTDKKAGTITWALCTLLCLVGCFCGCCLIPFCANPTQDILHKCPNCKQFLGAYERIKLRR